MTTAKYARKNYKARLKRREQAKRRRHRLMVEAKRMLADLISVLGGRCVICGESGENAPLTIDHKNGITWDRYAVRYDARVRRYYEEYIRGVPLRCLCLPCNSGNQPAGSDEITAMQLEDVPF